MDSFSRQTNEGKPRDIVDFPRVLRQIESLRVMTVERGCTKNEAEISARKIGEAVQRYGLVVRPPALEQRPARDTFPVHIDSVLAETDKALLVLIEDEECWIPLSQICEESEVKSKYDDGGTLIVTRWFAERAGLCRRKRT